VCDELYIWPYYEDEDATLPPMGWLRLAGSLKLWVSFAKEPYKRYYILQKRPMIFRSLLIVAISYLSNNVTTTNVLCVFIGKYA